MKRLSTLVALLSVSIVVIPASEVHGEITLEVRVVSKTAPPAVYDLRGMTSHTKRTPSADSGRFGHIAVWLEGEQTATAPITSTMQQSHLHFEPDLLILPPGSKVIFPNLDPVFHNIFSLSPSQRFDLGYYAEGKSREVTFTRSGIVQVYCHVHPEMYGIIVVTPSRWTARPASDGTFSFAGVPSGKYKVVVWQRAVGVLHKNILVPSSGQVGVNFRLPADEADK